MSERTNAMYSEPRPRLQQFCVLAEMLSRAGGFTIEDIAKAADVPLATVRTVRQRYANAIEDLGVVSRQKRGGQIKQFRIRPSAAAGIAGLLKGLQDQLPRQFIRIPQPDAAAARRDIQSAEYGLLQEFGAATTDKQKERLVRRAQLALRQAGELLSSDDAAGRRDLERALALSEARHVGLNAARGPIDAIAFRRLVSRASAGREAGVVDDLFAWAMQVIAVRTVAPPSVSPEHQQEEQLKSALFGQIFSWSDPFATGKPGPRGMSVASGVEHVVDLFCTDWASHLKQGGTAEEVDDEELAHWSVPLDLRVVTAGT